MGEDVPCFRMMKSSSRKQILLLILMERSLEFNNLSNSVRTPPVSNQTWGCNYQKEHYYLRFSFLRLMYPASFLIFSTYFLLFCHSNSIVNTLPKLSNRQRRPHEEIKIAYMKQKAILEGSISPPSGFQKIWIQCTIKCRSSNLIRDSRSLKQRLWVYLSHTNVCKHGKGSARFLPLLWEVFSIHRQLYARTDLLGLPQHTQVSEQSRILRVDTISCFKHTHKRVGRDGSQ